MKVLVVLVALTWSNSVNVEGTLLETVQEVPRAFFPPPFFPPFQRTYPPAYPPGLFPPFNAPPECFPQPVIQEVIQPEVKVECPVCPEAEPCLCEAMLQTCQTYTITVCPSAPPVIVEEVAPAPVLEEIIDEKVVDVTTGEVISEKHEVVDITNDFTSSPTLYGPLGGFTPFPGYNQLVGMYPQFAGFPVQIGASEEVVTATRSLGDDDKKEDKSKRRDKIKGEKK